MSAKAQAASIDSIENVRVRLDNPRFSLFEYFNTLGPASSGFTPNPLSESPSLLALEKILRLETEVRETADVFSRPIYGSKGENYYFPREELSKLPGITEVVINQLIKAGILNGMLSTTKEGLQDSGAFIGVTDLGKTLYPVFKNSSKSFMESQTHILPIMVDI